MTPILVGHKYRNGAGQVREVLAVDTDTITFRVLDSRAANALQPLTVKTNKRKVFESWAWREV